MRETNYEQKQTEMRRETDDDNWWYINNDNNNDNRSISLVSCSKERNWETIREILKNWDKKMKSNNENK